MKYKYKPKTKKELIEAIKKEIYEIQGTLDYPNWQADLNCIDTSLITDMSSLFSDKYDLEKFNGDISNWNVSNVENMAGMFENSNFNGDISNWNVSNVKDMNEMFYNSKFNQDVSKWDVSNVRDMSRMFVFSKFNGDISNWNVSNVKNMIAMFSYSEFNRDISNWDVSNVEYMNSMFSYSKFNQDISKWNVSNVENMDWMFEKSNFNQDISKWNISNVKNMEGMFYKSKFNGDIGFWPLKEETGLENISVSLECNKLPDKIICPETVQNILKNKDILYKPETITKLLVYSLENKDKNFNFKIFFKNYLKEKKEYYQNKSYKPDIVSKLILNDIADILKHIKDKNMQQKFMEIIMNKNGKETEIEIS